MSVTIKRAGEFGRFITNWSPSFTIVIEIATLRKICIGKLNVRCHLEMSRGIIPHIIEFGLVRNEIRKCFCSNTARELGGFNPYIKRRGFALICNSKGLLSDNGVVKATYHSCCHINYF